MEKTRAQNIRYYFFKDIIKSERLLVKTTIFIIILHPLIFYTSWLMDLLTALKLVEFYEFLISENYTDWIRERLIKGDATNFSQYGITFPSHSIEEHLTIFVFIRLSSIPLAIWCFTLNFKDYFTKATKFIKEAQENDVYFKKNYILVQLIWIIFIGSCFAFSAFIGGSRFSRFDSLFTGCNYINALMLIYLLNAILTKILRLYITIFKKYGQ
jgi:hypothetical protein